MGTYRMRYELLGDPLEPHIVRICSGQKPVAHAASGWQDFVKNLATPRPVVDLLSAPLAAPALRCARWADSSGLDAIRGSQVPSINIANVSAAIVARDLSRGSHQY